MVKTILEQGGTNFSQMIKEFGAVTVMNARIYDVNGYDFSSKTAYEIYQHFNDEYSLATLDTLKVANVTVEGPSKTVTGGQYSNPLIKFGKTARFEMQDALGRANALEAFGGVVNEYSDKLYGTIQAVHATEDFVGPRLIIGDSFFIDRNSGKQVDVILMFYQVLPDSIFNLTQDAEGDATVFDMNGDLLTTTIKTYDRTGAIKQHGVFYSILDKHNESATASLYTINASTLVVTKGGTTVATSELKYSSDGGTTWVASAPTVTNGTTYMVRHIKNGVVEFEGSVVGVVASA